MKISILLLIVFLAFIPPVSAKETPTEAPKGLGVKPVDEWNCPDSHPIKGNLNPQKHTMIYHLPGGFFYERTKPERCYATEEDARADGFRKSKR